MKFRLPKRPLNECRDCGHTWFPRGRDLARRCTACSSTNVASASALALEAFASLLVDLAHGIWFLLRIPLRAAWAAVYFVYQVFAKAIDRLAHRQIQVQAVDDTLSGCFADMLAIALYVGWSLPSSGFRWLYSVKDDLRAAVGDRRVNPVGMIAKLVLICLLAVSLIGGSIEVFRNWSRGG